MSDVSVSLCCQGPVNVRRVSLTVLQGPLPLDSSVLGERALFCRAYAKALHYKEEQFHRSPSAETLESLIR